MENTKEKKNEIIIGLAKPEDAVGIQQVFYITWLDTYPNEELGITVDDIKDHYKDSLSEEKLKKRIEAIINPPEGQTMFVAKEGDKVVGVCRVEKGLEKNKLRTIYVSPEFQGKGVGSMLWNQAKTVFDMNKDVVVDVVTYNTKAIEFYKKLGFEDTGKRFTDERFTMKSGATMPEMEMVIKANKVN